IPAESVGAMKIWRLYGADPDTLEVNSHLERMVPGDLGHVVKNLIHILVLDRRHVSGRSKRAESGDGGRRKTAIKLAGNKRYSTETVLGREVRVCEGLQVQKAAIVIAK